MKIVITADILQKKLSLINHAITNKQLPILSQILLTVKKEIVTMSATDLEIGIETEIPSEIIEEGTITIPAKLFTELINNLPQEKISLQLNTNSLEVKSKKTKSIFQTMNTDEFPSLFEEKGNKIFSLKPETLQKIFHVIVFSSSLETTRPALSGVFLKKSEKGFVFVATDGYRLSLKNENQETEKESLQEKPVIIPARVIREAMSLKEENNVTLFVSNQNNQVVFSQNGTNIVGRLIEAEFPNYQKIIPTEAASKIFFDREELLKAVKTCAIFARESANIITFSFKKDSITVSAKSPSVGENTVEVEAKLMGEENEIAFNSKYLIDVLSNLEEDNILFEMTGPLNPGVFKIQDDDSFLHLIMPIRTQG